MATHNLTVEYLRQILHYDLATGIFKWTTARPKIKIGDMAGGIAAKGHIAIKIDGRSYKAHRLAWLYVTGKWPEDQIDHRNGIPDDNRFENLRECTTSENCQNQGLRSNNTSGFQGVHKHGKKWAASISVKMKRTHLGFFNSPKEAGAAYAEAKSKYHVDSPVFTKSY